LGILRFGGVSPLQTLGEMMIGKFFEGISLGFFNGDSKTDP
jgi:hypothetical protein